MSASILRERPISLRDAALPYLAAGLNMLAPILATRPPRLMPGVFLVSLVLIAVGIPFSIFARRRGYSRFWVYLFTTLPLLIVTWVIAGPHPGLAFDWNDPMASLVAIDAPVRFEGLLQVVILFSAGRSLQLLTESDLFQTPLAGFLAFLMLAVMTRDTLSHDPLVVVSLAILCGTTLYLIGYLHARQWTVILPSLRHQRLWVVHTSLLIILLFPLAIGLGYALQPLNMESLALRGRDRTFGNFRLPFAFGARPGIRQSEDITFGPADWPTGKQPVMRIRVPGSAPTNLLWRGATYDTYDGNTWKPTFGPDSVAPAEGDWSYTQPLDARGAKFQRLSVGLTGPLGDPGIHAWMKETRGPREAPDAWLRREDSARNNQIYVPQEITIYAPALTGRIPVYGAYWAFSFNTAGRYLSRSTPRRDGVFSWQNYRGGSRIAPYVVESIIKPSPRSFTLKHPVSLPEADRAAYLQLPPAADEIRALADRILADGKLTAAGDPVRIVTEIELYLSRNYRYSLRPANPPRGRDPVVDFLTRQRKGYCVYFASSMALLCRAAGVPARMVTGYATGDQVDAETTGEVTVYEVTAERSHAWTEVFLPSYGWYTVDATAGAQIAPTSWETFIDTVANARDAVKTWWANLVSAFRTDVRARWRIILGTLGAILLVIALYFLIAERPPRPPRRPLTDEQARALIIALYPRLVRWLDSWGVLKPAHLTLSEFHARLAALSPALADPLAGYADLYLRARYAPLPITDADARAAIAILRTIWHIGRTERSRLFSDA